MSTFKSNLLLLLAAAIWGFAFVAQRVGMEYVGPFMFNGVRFALGAFSLLPLMFFYRKGSQHVGNSDPKLKNIIGAGLLAGLVLFLGATFQQIGLIYTTAGKAAFTTCLYIVIVPMLGIFFKQYISMSTWFGCIVAIMGLYLLCVKEDFSISYGEVLELIGAFLWSIHILIIDRFSKKINVLTLSFVQFSTCSVLSLVAACFTETMSIDMLRQALVPLLYGGIFSVGIAYTLQAVGQKYAQPSHTAIILSMETVFAAIGGWIILNERLGVQELIGCAIMLIGMLLAQLQNIMGPHIASDELVLDSLVMNSKLGSEDK